MADRSVNIKFFTEISKKDIAQVGGKGANLGEMTQADLPVPPGFCVTSHAFQQFLKASKLDVFIKEQLTGLDRNDSKKLQEVAEIIKEKIVASPMPEDIQKDVTNAYKKLSKNRNAFVAVRSSATAEDLPGASFAGQQETYLDVRGTADVLQTVKMAWASLFESRAIFYREEQGFDHFKVSIAVPIQKMVQSEVSGVMFTVDPLSNDHDKITIEAIYGLGDALVSGQTTPDQYLVSKTDWKIVDTHVVKQSTMLGYAASAKKEEQVATLPVSRAYQNKQKLTEDQIIALAKLGKQVEDHYAFPQDIEWALENKTLYLVQTRPITTLQVSEQDEVKAVPTPTVQQSDLPQLPTLLEGLGASPGIGMGPVRVIHSAKEINKVKKGEVLVTEMTTPDFVPAMRRAVSIVTDEGGRTSHAAIVSRELGIPAVVGTQNATKMLKDGEKITIDGTQGKIYEGDVSEQLKLSAASSVSDAATKALPTKTATKVYLNLGEPDLADEMAKRDVDGVGLLRAEFMMAQIGVHPRHALDQGKRDDYIQQLYEGLLTFARAFDPRPVVYRTSDFRTNEYQNLTGGKKYETDEENPMIGFRGVSRYLADPEVFTMEIEAIKRVRRYHQNLHVMLPFVRTPEELVETKKILADHGLYRGGSFKLWIMVEVPSTVILLDKFIGVGIDGVSIGSNDLTQLVLGVDRDNSKLGTMFDERNEAVMWALKHVVKVCHAHGVTSSICGQAPSVYPEISYELVRAGVTSVSVSPDMIETTRSIVAQAELALVQGKK